MNKLEGFYELKKNGLPTVDWKIFNSETKLDSSILWTIRSAVEKGADLNLPRLVGAISEDAETFAKDLLKKMTPNDMVLYYPYFIAEKSGVLEVAYDKVVIEAVYGDLWNMVTYNNRDITLIIEGTDFKEYGKEKFFPEKELSDILSYVNMLKNRYRDYLFEGKSIFLEWSFSYCSTINKEKTGDKTLVFYEIRSV